MPPLASWGGAWPLGPPLNPPLYYRHRCRRRRRRRKHTGLRATATHAHITLRFAMQTALATVSMNFQHCIANDSVLAKVREQ